MDIAALMQQAQNGTLDVGTITQLQGALKTIPPEMKENMLAQLPPGESMP